MNPISATVESNPQDPTRGIKLTVYRENEKIEIELSSTEWGSAISLLNTHLRRKNIHDQRLSQEQGKEYKILDPKFPDADEFRRPTISKEKAETIPFLVIPIEVAKRIWSRNKFKNLAKQIKREMTLNDLFLGLGD